MRLLHYHAIIDQTEFAAFRDALSETSGNVVVFVVLPGAQHAFDLFHSPRFESVIDGVEAFATAVRSARNVSSRHRGSST